MARTNDRKKLYTTISVEVLKDFNQELCEVLEEEGINKSELIRHMLYEYVFEYKKANQ